MCCYEKPVGPLTSCLKMLAKSTGSLVSYSLSRSDRFEIWADGRKSSELWRCLTCLYSQVAWSTHNTNLMSHQWGVSTPSYTKHAQSQQGTTILHSKAWFCACGPTQAHGSTVHWAHLKVMGTLLLLVAQTSGWGAWPTPFALQLDSHSLFQITVGKNIFKLYHYVTRVFVSSSSKISSLSFHLSLQSSWEPLASACHPS